MADNEVSNYMPAGWMDRPDTDPTDFDDGQKRLFVKCTRCGSLVNGGGLSREKHDQFHAALAELWEMLAVQEAIHIPTEGTNE